MFNFLKKEKTTSNQMHSITFRLTAEDKFKLSEQAEALKISLSEYVRNKAMLDDKEVQKILDEIGKLKQQNKEYQIQLKTRISHKKEAGIFLKTTKDNIKFLKSALSNIPWNRFTRRIERIEDDSVLSKALLFILAEYLIEPLNEMQGLRAKYGIVTPEKLFSRMAGDYIK